MVTLPKRLVPYEIQGDEILPIFFDRRDVPWVRELIELCQALEGRPRRELELRWPSLVCAFGPAVDSPSRALVPVALHVLQQIYKPTVRSVISPGTARAALFVAATRDPRASAMRATAKRFDITEEQLTASLFADLPDERCLAAPEDLPTPEGLLLQANTAMIRAILRFSLDLRLRVRGNSRAIVRLARLLGLMLVVPSPSHDGDSFDAEALEITGPLAGLTQSTRYGNAVAQLVPALPWCPWFRLEARCRLGSERDIPHRLILTKSSPIEPGREPRRFDSKVEARFARAFVRATDRWTLLREPEPLPAGGSLVFPDFEILPVGTDQTSSTHRWWLEIVGFWTTSYLERKFAHLRAAGLDRLILCVDRARACELDSLAGFANLVWFDRQPDVRDVLAILSREP